MIVLVGGDIVALVSGVSGNIILLPWWAWLIIGTTALIVAQFLAYHEVRKQRDEAGNKVASAISELESDIIRLGERSISMATLFWKMRELLLNGIPAGTLPGSIYTTFEGANGDECNKAWGSLMYRLRLLQLIDDRQCQHGIKGYTKIITTSLGTSVLNELEKRWRDRR